MSISRTAWLDAVTDVSTTALHTLGTLREFVHPTYGHQVYRYILSRGTITAGLGAMQETGTDMYECILSGATTPNVRVMGVSVSALTTGVYGWVLCEGFGSFVSNGTTTADTVQICAANGQFTDGTAVTSEGIVWASETEDPAGAAGLFQGYIRAL
jgi:hypothetical protein